MLKRELPVDCLEFFVLTPLPGSEDHQKLARARRRDGARHEQVRPRACLHRARADDAEEWQGVYQRAWSQYYSMEHIETLLRRAVADGMPAKRLMLSLVVFRGMPLIEHMHPLQGGYLRRRVGRTRRPGFAPQHPLLARIHHAFDNVGKMARLGALLWRINVLRRRIAREHAANPYSDDAIARPKSPIAERGAAAFDRRPARPSKR